MGYLHANKKPLSQSGFLDEGRYLTRKQVFLVRLRCPCRILPSDKHLPFTGMRQSIPAFVRGDRLAVRFYQAKCANALLASAIRCVVSFLLTATPSPLYAALISFRSDSFIGFPFVPSAACTIQRSPKARRRSGRTSRGTW